MPILASCAACKHQLQAPDHLAGRNYKCPKCGATATVPRAAAARSAAPAPARPAPRPAAPKPAREEYIVGDEAVVETAGAGDVYAVGDGDVVQGPMTPYGVALFGPNSYAELGVPANHQQAIQDALIKGEKIVWLGKPDQQLLESNDSKGVVVGICAVIVGIGLMSLIVLPTPLRDVGLPGMIVAGIVGSAFVLVGLIAACLPFFAHLLHAKFANQRSWYVVTNRRALVVQGNVDAPPDIEAFYGLKLVNMERKQHPKIANAGDLVFGMGSRAPQGRFIVVTHGDDKGKQLFPVGFLDIRQVREVERLIRETFHL